MIDIIYSVKKSKYIEDKYGFYAPIKFDHFIKLFAITPEDLRKSILGATNTGNIAAKPDVADDEYFCSDDTDDGLVSL